MALKRKLCENKEYDFIVIKDYGQFILKGILSYIIWKAGDMDKMGFILKFALMQNNLLLENMCYL